MTVNELAQVLQGLIDSNQSNLPVVTTSDSGEYESVGVAVPIKALMCTYDIERTHMVVLTDELTTN